MKQVLIDTSVWVDYFSKKPRHSTELLDRLIAEDSALVAMPILAELWSASWKKNAEPILEGLSKIQTLKEDWNSDEIWREASEIAPLARRGKVSACGLVDRLILALARRHDTQLWTFDRKLSRLQMILEIESPIQ